MLIKWLRNSRRNDKDTWFKVTKRRNFEVLTDVSTSELLQQVWSVQTGSEPGMEGFVVYFTDGRKTEQNFQVIHSAVLKFLYYNCSKWSVSQ